MVQTDLGFSSTKSTKTTQAAACKSKQIKRLLGLLCSKQKSLKATLSSFAYFVDDPVCRGNAGKRRKTSCQHQTHPIQHLMYRQPVNKWLFKFLFISFMLHVFICSFFLSFISIGIISFSITFSTLTGIAKN